MSLNGVWTGEILGPYGWENTGVYVLEDGRIIGGSNRHYSTGTYSLTDDAYQADVMVHYYGPPRAIFGEEREQFEIAVKGKLADGIIEGEIVRSDRPQSFVAYRMTKRMDVPPK